MVRQKVQKAMDIPDNPEFEVLYRIRRRDGEIRWVWDMGNLFLSPMTAPFYRGFIRDVTSWKQAETELRNNFQRMEFIKLFHETLQEPGTCPP
jgi:PAS domain S-box-containing protein